MEGNEHGVTPRTSHALVPCRSDAIHVVQQLLTHDLEACHADPHTADTLLLVLAEAVGNAVAGAVRRGQQRMLTVSWTLQADLVRISLHTRAVGVTRAAVVQAAVSSQAAHPAMGGGVGRTPHPGSPREVGMRAHPSAGPGRGRGIMDVLMDQVVVHDGDQGSRILMEKRLG